MTDGPYAPPKSQVSDVLPKQSVSWGRVVWFNFPIVAVLLLIVFNEWQTLRLGLTGWGIWMGIVLTGVLLHFPARAIHNLSEAAPPWYWDVLYYSTVTLGVGGVIHEDANLIVAGGLPTVLLLAITGVLALLTERRRGVRVHMSGRRYLFRNADGAL